MIDQFYQNPYLVILAVLAAQFLLIYFRKQLKNDKQKPGLLIGNAQTRGKRKEQEDSFSTVENEHGTMAVIADGMGGYSDGKLASSIVVSTFVDRFTNAELHSVEKFLKDTAILCNHKILERGKQIRTGSTLVAVIVTGESVNWISVGDSAIILFRKGELIHLNKKHIFQSMLEEQYISGQISKEELVNNRKKKRLTSYIGHDGLRELELNQKPVKLLPGDKLILCSDGVYNSVSELEMEQIFSRYTNPNKAAETIIELIKEKNYLNQDNATIVIVGRNR